MAKQTTKSSKKARNFMNRKPSSPAKKPAAIKAAAKPKKARGPVKRKMAIKSPPPRIPGTVSTASEKKLDKAIGLRIKDRRTKLGISQENLGMMMGVTFQQIQKYENGSNRVAGSKLIGIGNALEASPAYFLGVTEKDAEIELPSRKILELSKVASSLSEPKQNALLIVARAL